MRNLRLSAANLTRHSSPAFLIAVMAIAILNLCCTTRGVRAAEDPRPNQNQDSRSCQDRDRSAGYGEPYLAIVDRSIAQTQGRWLAAYRLRLEADEEYVTVIQPRDIIAQVDAWVSNARVPGLERPVFSRLVVKGDGQRSAICDLIVPSRDWDSERREKMITRERCRMALVRESDFAVAPAPTRSVSPAFGSIDAHQVILTKFTAANLAPAIIQSQVQTLTSIPTPTPSASSTAEPIRIPSFDQPLEAFRFATGDTIVLLLDFEHQRFLYGPYDPLLGQRALELKLGELTFRDTLPMSRDRRAPLPRCPLDLEPIPEDRLDPTQYVSAPHSLHLESHIAGNQAYRFKEQEVRYSTPMRLSFWYLVAHGTQGQPKAKVSQYCEGPAQHWREVDGGFEVNLDVVGQWVHVEKIFRTHAQANTLDLHFRIVNGDIGETWIDDIVLEPLDSTPHEP